MAILTSKGARAPHQLKGRRNVRISRDRRGCGNDDIEQLKDEVNKALAEYQKKYHKVNLQANKTINIKISYGNYFVNIARDGDQYSLSAFVNHIFQSPPNLHYLYDKGSYLDVTTKFSDGQGNLSIKNTSTETVTVSIIELNKEVTYTIS